jgi:hypothetical protein
VFSENLAVLRYRPEFLETTMPFTFSLARLPRIEFGAGRISLLPVLIANMANAFLLLPAATHSLQALTGHHCWKR